MKSNKLPSKVPEEGPYQEVGHQDHPESADGEAGVERPLREDPSASQGLVRLTSGKKTPAEDMDVDAEVYA